MPALSDKVAIITGASSGIGAAAARLFAAENDQTRARLDSVKRLSAGETEARAVLQRCRQKTPRLG